MTIKKMKSEKKRFTKGIKDIAKKLFTVQPIMKTPHDHKTRLLYRNSLREVTELTSDGLGGGQGF